MGGSCLSVGLAEVHGPPLVIVPGTPATIAATLAARVIEWPDGLIRSYNLEGTGPSESYANAWRRSAAIAAGLRAFGVRAGATVVLIIDDVTDFVPAYWACIRSGFVAAPLMSAAREATHRRGDPLSEALDRLTNVTILTDESFAEIAVAVRRERGLRVLPLGVAEAEASYSDADAAPADPFCLLPTSGSTGRLKLVAVNHSTQMFRCFADKLAIEERHLGTFSLDGITGQNSVFLRYGSWTQLSAKALTARPTSVLDAIQQHQITAVSLTNSMIKRIVAAAEQTSRKWNLSSLRRIAVGGEPVVPSVIQRLGHLLQDHGASRDIVRVGYGTSETGFLVTGSNPFDAKIDLRNALNLGGCPPGVGLRIVGGGDQILSEGDPGEVEVTCPQKIFSCYWGEPDATRECFTADGWWRTGDLGQLKNGELSLHGRTKEVLVVSGKKFSLTEIDAVIETVLAIGSRAFCCAVHWPEEESERLAVVVADDAANEHQAELVEKIRAIVARRFGLPVDPVIRCSLDDVPLASNGKLRRTELADRIRQGLLAATLQASQAVPVLLGATVEEKLAQIWREALDLRGHIDKHANFFDLGGDSLRSLMLYTSIEGKFGQQISAEAFFASPTFADLLRLVAKGGALSALGPEPSRLAVPWPLPNDVRNKLLVHFESWDGSRPTRDRLVAGLNLAGSKISLFWVFQEAIEFREVARVLGPDQPIYAFRSGLGLIKYQEDEVQALALRYVSEIEEVCPDGPVFVGGFCQGAIIALAIAQHLLRRKRHVPLLMLMEWGFPLQPYAGPVLLIHGRDSIEGNPFLRYCDPDAAFAQAFPDYVIAEMPGDHDHVFEDTNVTVLGEILTAYMRKAESAPPRLIPKSSYRADITAAGIPGTMNQSHLHAELAAVRQRAADLEAELENQKASSAQARIRYEQALSGYQTSTSWRVTRPLRWIKGLVIRERR